VARPKDRAIDVSGPGGRGDGTGEPGDHPSHRATRLLVLAALVLVVGAYGLLQALQHQSPERSVDAYCRQVGAASSLDDALGNLDGPASQAAFTQLEALDDVAPDQIEPQLRTVVEASRPLVEVLQTSSPDQEQAMRQVLQARQGDVARVDAAAKAVEAYTSSTCHHDLATSIPTTTPSSVASTSTTAFAPPKPTTSSSIKAVPPPPSTTATTARAGAASTTR